MYKYVTKQVSTSQRTTWKSIDIAIHIVKSRVATLSGCGSERNTIRLYDEVFADRKVVHILIGALITNDTTLSLSLRQRDIIQRYIHYLLLITNTLELNNINRCSHRHCLTLFIVTPTTLRVFIPV